MMVNIEMYNYRLCSLQREREREKSKNGSDPYPFAVHEWYNLGWNFIHNISVGESKNFLYGTFLYIHVYITY